MTMMLKVKRIVEGVAIPYRANSRAAGFDLPMLTAWGVGCLLQPGQTKVFGTGYALAIPRGCVGLVRPRGSASKASLLVQGTYDDDYVGECKIIVTNAGSEAITIEDGKIIAQMIIVKAEAPTIDVVADLPSTDRGDGHFGSTGNSVGS